MGMLQSRTEEIEKKDPLQVLSALEENAEILEIKIQKYQQEIEEKKEEAKKLYKMGQKTKATVILKQNKTKENQIRQWEGQLRNIQQQIMSVESAATTTSLAGAMSDGNLTIKEMMNDIDVDDIHEIAHDMIETTDMVKEIGDALAQDIDFVDELNIEEEFEKWDAEKTDILDEFPDAPVQQFNRKELENSNAQRLLTKDGNRI